MTAGSSVSVDAQGGRATVELVVDQAEERIELVKEPQGWRIAAFPR